MNIREELQKRGPVRTDCILILSMLCRIGSMPS